jgi:hypothetical protein
MSSFKKASRSKLKGRIAIDGPSGAGKTLSGLRFAFVLGAKVAVIDTENDSASKYCGLTYDGVKLDFDVCKLDNFAPTRFAELITEASNSGYDAVVIDSLSHAWIGEGGALDLKDRQGGNFQAWAKITPLQRQMVDAILRAPAHIIATMRSKTEYVIQQDGGRVTGVQKVGTAPVQREGMEYEFDLVCSMDYTHTLTVTKSRCPEMADRTSVKPGRDFIMPFKRWLEEGSEKVMILPDTKARILGLKVELKINDFPFSQGLYNNYRVKMIEDLGQDDALDLLGKLEGKKRAAAEAKTEPEVVVA